MASVKVFRIQRRSSRNTLLVLVLAALFPIMMLISTSLLTGVDPRRAFEKLGLAVQSLSFLEFWPVFVFPLFLILDRMYRNSARLYLDEEGVRFQSGLPPLARRLFYPDWSLRWDEMKSVRYFERLKLLRVGKKNFVLQPKVIRLLDWVGEAENDEVAATQDFHARTLTRALEARGLISGRHAGGESEDPVTFDLTAHPATRRILLIGAVLAIFGLADNFYRTETYLADSFAYLVPSIVLGVLSVAAAGWFLLRIRTPRIVPPIVAVGLAFVFSLAAGIAGYSGVVRAGQIFGGPLIDRPYHRDASCTRLVPEDAQLPQMIFAGWLKEYWCQYPVEKTIQLPVRKALFGFYQVDQSVFAEDIEKFRREKSKLGKWTTNVESQRKTERSAD